MKDVMEHLALADPAGYKAMHKDLPKIPDTVPPTQEEDGEDSWVPL